MGEPNGEVSDVAGVGGWLEKATPSYSDCGFQAECLGQLCISDTNKAVSFAGKRFLFRYTHSEVMGESLGPMS